MGEVVPTRSLTLEETQSLADKELWKKALGKYPVKTLVDKIVESAYNLFYNWLVDENFDLLVDAVKDQKVRSVLWGEAKIKNSIWIQKLTVLIETEKTKWLIRAIVETAPRIVEQRKKARNLEIAERQRTEAIARNRAKAEEGIRKSCNDFLKTFWISLDEIWEILPQIDDVEYKLWFDAKDTQLMNGEREVSKWIVTFTVWETIYIISRSGNIFKKIGNNGSLTHLKKISVVERNPRIIGNFLSNFWHQSSITTVGFMRRKEHAVYGDISGMPNAEKVDEYVTNGDLYIILAGDWKTLYFKIDIEWGVYMSSRKNGKFDLVNIL